MDDNYYSVAVHSLNKMYDRFNVPEEVYLYIRQLEYAMDHPEVADKLRLRYKERFLATDKQE